MSEGSKISVDLRQMVTAIETAVDLVGINDTNHGKRVGYIALQIANNLGFSEEEKQTVYELGLLHDCGVSSDLIRVSLSNQFDWEESDKHCQIGHDLLKDFLPLAHLAIPIRYHHTQWESLQALDLQPLEKRLANLIFLADRIDISAAPFYGREVLLHTDFIKEIIENRAGSHFNPDLVKGFLSASETEAFWISLEDRHISRFAWDMGNRGYEKKLGMGDLLHLARIFSFIVDQKSAFTAEHSYGVARLSRFMAQKMGLPAHDVDKLEVAGYLHDIGKLYVPDNILHKAGPLTALERAIINQHSYETYEILRSIKGLEDIAKWAAYHHDNCEGTGYPFHPSVKELSLQARIVAVSDVFQALVQNRPYRKGMDIDQVIGVLYEMSSSGQLDKKIVEMVVGNAAQCFKIAKGEE